MYFSLCCSYNIFNFFICKRQIQESPEARSLETSRFVCLWPPTLKVLDLLTKNVHTTLIYTTKVFMCTVPHR